MLREPQSHDAVEEVRRGKALAFPSSQPPLISAKDEIPGERELGSSQAQLLLSPWVEESLGTSKQLELKSLKSLQKKFCMGASPEELQL